jgi:hypothetical protein
MFRVSHCSPCHDEPGEEMVTASFEKESEARSYINMLADGSVVFTLWEGDEVIVRSAFPVLMVA